MLNNNPPLFPVKSPFATVCNFADLGLFVTKMDTHLLFVMVRILEKHHVGNERGREKEKERKRESVSKRLRD